MKCPRCNHAEREEIRDGLIGTVLGNFMIQNYANEYYVTCGECGYTTTNKIQFKKKVKEEENNV